MLTTDVKTECAFPLAGRELHAQRLVINIGKINIGDGSLTVIAGPCSVESEEQIFTTAEAVASSGAHILRGGAFKPRTSPYSFQGMGKEGLSLLSAAGKAHGLLTISEVMDTDTLDTVCQYVDILQVGSRNMQNFSLLKTLGTVDKPIFLKRGFAATYTDLLHAAEHILEKGNSRVILCERGIRTFEHSTRNTLDIGAVPMLHEMSRLPVFVDPSHGCGVRKIVPHLTRAAIAAGADGVMLEVHPCPEQALSDGHQSLSITEFQQLRLSE
ncbi:3-deoxy-7-phosphoheptulonate synthase, partial [Simkania negevensis]|nr:3-deoxy-7-phosphoheptulonate synthase [Simkania negevensis]